jgi:GNAT superfamily N-acetyltransferase
MSLGVERILSHSERSGGSLPELEMTHHVSLLPFASEQSNSMTDDYSLDTRIPDIADYRRLREQAGLSSKSEEAAARGLPRTIHAVVVRCTGQAVGMGRVIGDGGLFYQVTDIAVDPAHQGRGLGKAIMASLMDQLRASALPGAYVSLMADGEAHRLYAQFGFRPTMPQSLGMAQVLR